MGSFFSSALGLITGNEGLIPVVVIFAFSTIVTAIIKKTTTLNQKQSYGIIALIFIGLMVFLIAVYSIFMTPTDAGVAKQSKVKIENSLKDIKDSNVSLSGDIDMKESGKGISNSTIIIK
jgi:hypothetical protein